jgi:hypothetical protein
MNNPKRYVGIYNDEQGGMTNIAKMIRDAWLFDLIPETETCEGWLPTQLQVLYEGFMPLGAPLATSQVNLTPHCRKNISEFKQKPLNTPANTAGTQNLGMMISPN